MITNDIDIGPTILQYENSSGNFGLLKQPCFVGKITNLDWIDSIIQFVIYEHNESDPYHKFYCKKSVSCDYIYQTQTLFAVHVEEAKKYAMTQKLILQRKKRNSRKYLM